MTVSRFPVLLPSGWFMIIALPSMLMVFNLASSFSIGILCSSVIFLTVLFIHSLLRKNNTRSEYSVKNIILLIFFLLFIMLHFYIVNMLRFHFNQVDLNRFILSYITFSLMLCCALSIATSLKNVSDEYFYKSCMMISIILFCNGLISLSQIDFFGTGLAKPSFIYLEPSHFALAVAPFISYYCLTTTRVKGILMLLFVAGWAAYIQNMTMMLAVIIAYLLSTRKNLVLSLSVLMLVGSTLVVFIDADKLSYFSDRLSLSGSSDNLSVLVLYQGWDNAIKTLASSWLGGGFQQFGITTLTGDVSEKLYQLLGFDINQFDGGSTAPKIVGEFGLFGLILLVVYLVALNSLFRKIRTKSIENKKNLFASTVIITSVLEFFVRGVGYFSPSLFMLAVSIFYLLDNARKEKTSQKESNIL